MKNKRIIPHVPSEDRSKLQEGCDEKIYLSDVMCRFLFLITIPICVLNIVIAGIIAIPFWIITGKVIYGTKMIQGFNSWHHSLYYNDI